MKMLSVVVTIFALVSACASNRAANIPCEVAVQLPAVESQIYRQGFTCARLPKGTRVGAQFLFDNSFSEDQLLEQRRCSFSTHAVAYSIAEGDPVYLFGDEKHRKDGAAHLAGITADGTLWANESYTSTDNAEFTRLPSRDTLERRRAECVRR